MTRRWLFVLWVPLALAAPLFGDTAVAGDATPSAASGYRANGQATTYRGVFSNVAVEIDAYWRDTFATAGAAYRSPRITVVDRRLDTACGPIEPEPNAFYCAPDATIYLVPSFLDEQAARFGDYAPILILAHEWGHHVQQQTGAPRRSVKEFELQADCLAGTFTARADELALLDAGDVLEAIQTSIEAGDPIGLPVDHPGSHGSGEERVKALMKGYGGGPDRGCEIFVGSVDRRVGIDFGHLLPDAPSLAHASCFFAVDEGDLDFAALLGRFAGVPDAASQLSALGWQDGAYRQFGCDGPPVGNAGWIDVSVHVFGDVASAQAAVAFFADARISGTSLGYDEAPGLGDAAAAISGPASNGWEYTLYASEGPVLVRVTGVAPVGTPDADVAAVMADTLGRVPADSGPAPAVADLSSEPAPGSGSGVDVLAMLPDHLGIPNGACFLPVEDWRFSAGEVLPWLEDTGAPAALVAGWNWQDGATRALRCATPLPGGAVQIDVTAHRFGDAASARAAEAWVLRGYPTRPWEARSCGTAGTVVVCVTGRGEDTPPDADVAAVLAQVLGEG